MLWVSLFQAFLIALGFFIVGYIVGIVQGGIKIFHKESYGQEPTEYNPIITDNLTKEVMDYLNETRGNIGG